MYKGFSSDNVASSMKLKIASEISLGVPRLLLGIVTVKNANNTRTNSVIPQLIRGTIASKQKELKKTAIESRESVELWKLIDKNPHILEVLETIETNDYLTFGNSLEDLAFYFSVRYEVPIVALDLDEVSGDIELCRASGNEPFRPRGSIKLEHATSGEVIYRDRAGVVCRDWSKHVSQRTALTTDTRNGGLMIETIGEVPLDKLKVMLKDMEKTLRTYCGGAVEIAIIGETVTEIDLGVTGTSGVNDSEYKPDPRRLAFHQKLLENFEKMRNDSLAGKKAGMSLSAKAPKQKLTAPPEEKELSAPKEEKELSPPHEEKALPPPEAEKDLPAPPEEKLLPAPAETSLIEILTRKLTRHSSSSASSSSENYTSPLLSSSLQSLLKKAIHKAFPDITDIANFEPFIEQAKDPSHGDYATNAAMALSKTLKKAPQQVANAIIEHFEKPEFLEKLEFAQPGFINFTLSIDWVEAQLPDIISKKSIHLKPDLGHKRTVLVEYSSPNIAKPLGVHHLLSTIIGQAIYNIYDYLGYKTVAINHIGDWGTQFGKLTVAYKLWGDKKKVEKDPIEELLRLYVEFHNEVEKDKIRGEELEQQARDEFKKLEDGDKENTKLWQWFVAMSLKDAQKTYDALGGIHFDKIQGESFYSDKMDDIIKEGKEKKVFEIGEEGALVVKFEDDKLPPFLVQKSDGATLYGTRDLAAAKYRLATWKPLKVLYVVDVAQSLHFQQLFATAHKLTWNSDALTHISFGRMRFEDEKMSTRKGNIVRLNDVLLEAVERAKKIVAQKSPDVPEKHHSDLARIIGIGAVKYNILSQNRTTDIVFQWDKILSLDGNSAPYLQYTHARANSILKKANTEKRHDRKKSENQFTLFDAIADDESQESTNTSTGENSGKKPCELILAAQLLKFAESVARSADEYRPNLITNYLYETAKLFNTFYHEVPILQAESEHLRNFRLSLTRATKLIIKEGLELIGVEVPEEM